ncbi:MAG: RNA pseudouridine synthase [Desulfuromonadaceae bacterium GWC2_58_13]|nr:MAG: RNA pseudouridine synthase [Desulfuromonadaceae bacterium GWC2_58_13]
MTQTYRFFFEFGRAPERLDRFLSDCLPAQSRSQLKKLIDDGLVLQEGVSVKASLKLKGGEQIEVAIPPATPAEAVPQEIPLNILYEDRHLIIVDKPAGLVVHPAPGHYEGTLVNALLHHCRDLAGIGGELRPGIVHRLDKDTSGVMVATKDDATHQHLAAQFKIHSITRRYLALVYGVPEASAGTVDSPIGRHPVQRKKMSGQSRSGRRAVTHWRVLRRYPLDRLALVELTLETGRTHQIRVHFSEMGLPIVGDPVYGSSSRAKTLADPELRQRVQQLQRQFLHARVLGFVHPQTGQYLEFESPMPADLNEIIGYLDDKYRSSSETGF